MSETQQTDEEKSKTNGNINVEQLKHLTLNEENEVTKHNKCTPTLDYLQVP